MNEALEVEITATGGELLSNAIRVLKTRGVKGLNISKLRRCLNDPEFARTNFPNVPRGVWDVVLAQFYKQCLGYRIDGEHYLKTSKTRNL